MLGGLMDGLIGWCYTQIVGGSSDLFTMMANMGVELFDIEWVQSILLFFALFAWAMYVVGMVVAVFETAIEYQSGRGNIKDTALNAIKGFISVSIFTFVPVELYKLSINLQATIADGLTNTNTNGISGLATEVLGSAGGTPQDAINAGLFGVQISVTPLLMLLMLIVFVVTIIKVFFSNLKRGGILLTQICIGSLYIFSIPRGYMDGYVSWWKRIIALCITTFLQATILVCGMLILGHNAVMGLGLMLSAGEVPRIAEVYGLDTSTKTNIMGAVHATQSIVSVARTVTSVVK